MDKLKYVAKRLNMLPYRSEAKKEIVEFAKENGIVIVYGASDDLMELDGAIYDEFGCYEGGVCCLDSEGNILEEMTNNCRTIEAVWCGEGEKFTWTYKTDIPHETYEIYDDTEPYCKGIVFYKKDLIIDNGAVAVNTYEEMNNKIVGILRLSDQHCDLYAAKYIEELQAENKILRAALDRACGDIEELSWICDDCHATEIVTEYFESSELPTAEDYINQAKED